jgi:low affinity Fe/Cu permease
VQDKFARFSRKSAILVGAPLAFIIACGFTILWFLSGPIFNWSDTWQLIINTSTTVLTFLMVFLIQATQNRDAQAIHAKLDNLIKRLPEPDDELIGIENAPQEKLDKYGTK